MKYSIVTPVFNAVKYLSECIESVIRQTYSDWELILVDDGSTDESAAICDEYANKDSRIKVFHIENGGAYKARLFANEHINGDYTLGLDSDDMYEPSCLETIDKIVRETCVDMVVFGRYDLDDETNTKNKIDVRYETGQVYTKKDFLENALLLTDHALWNKAIKSEVYKKTNYIEEEYRLSMSLDYMQIVPLLCGINNAYVIDEALYIYRTREGSLSHNNKFNNIIDNDWLNVKFRDYLDLNGLYSDNIRYALEKSYADVVLPRLFALRWKLTIKEKKEVTRMFFLNSMNNNIVELTDNKCEKALIRYIKRGIWGPKDICYKLFLKCYLKPLKKKMKKL